MGDLNRFTMKFYYTFLAHHVRTGAALMAAVSLPGLLFRVTKTPASKLTTLNNVDPTAALLKGLDVAIRSRFQSTLYDNFGR
jgi:hypothetical protein